MFKIYFKVDEALYYLKYNALTSYIDGYGVISHISEYFNNDRILVLEDGTLHHVNKEQDEYIEEIHRLGELFLIVDETKKAIIDVTNKDEKIEYLKVSEALDTDSLLYLENGTAFKIKDKSTALLKVDRNNESVKVLIGKYQVEVVALAILAQTLFEDGTKLTTFDLEEVVVSVKNDVYIKIYWSDLGKYFLVDGENEKLIVTIE